MWTSTAHISILWFFVLFTPTHSFRYTIGAILRQKEDAHLRAALNFAVHWINDHHPELGNFGLRIQSIQPGDHYGAIQSSVTRLVSYLEKEQYASIRFEFVRVERGRFLEATTKIKKLKECDDVQEDCAEFRRIMVDMNPQDSYSFFLAALQTGFIELKHWFLLTSMFRHNHARFIAVDLVSPEFQRIERKFDFNEFKQQVISNWTFENENTMALKMEPISDVNVNMSQDSRAQLQDNVKVSDELKPHFRVTTIMERPYVMLKKNHFELDQNSQFEGFCIDLLHELSNDLGSISFRKIPTDQQPDFFSFLNPLSLEIWVSVLASIFGLSVGMYLVAQISPGEWNFNFSCCTAHQPHCGAKYETNDSVELSNNYSFWNTLWYANQTSILYGTIKGGSTMQFFQESKIPSHVKMWKTMMKQEKKVFVSSNRAGVEKVLTQNYAYLMESTSLEYETQQNCNLTQIGGVLGSKGYGIAQILLYQKRGVIEMKKQKWWRSKGAACQGVGSAVNQQRVSLSLYNVFGLFIILFSGLFFSAIAVLLEFFVRSRKVSKAEIKEEIRFGLGLSNSAVDHRTRKERANRQQSNNTEEAK
ncbi:Glutamate receptor ionotropic, kainate 2 [Aphelenchoides besseyi]|nr:Glutamate receptor ionotropic, kainate 2 [Aphelenchoides besseyi]